MRIPVVGTLVLLSVVPLSAHAQQIIIPSQSTSTVSYQLQELLQQYPTPSFAPWQSLTPPSTEGAVEKLEAALLNPAYVPVQIAPIPLATSSPVIQALLGQVAALQAQIAAIITAQGAASTTPSVPSGVVVPGAVVCPDIARTLFFGSSGNDVVNLQVFLIEAGHLEAGNATGFFGSLTEAAVQAWQTAQNIVSSGSPEETGWGVVGPQTRAALLSCSS